MRKFIALFMLAGILFVPAFANAQDAPADSAAATEATLQQKRLLRLQP